MITEQDSIKDKPPVDGHLQRDWDGIYSDEELRFAHQVRQEDYEWFENQATA